VESGSRSPCNRKNLQLSESQTFDRFHEFLRRAPFLNVVVGNTNARHLPFRSRSVAV